MLTNPTRVAGLYVIHLSDTHYYGGRSTNCTYRWKCHLRDLKAGKHDNKRMQAVYNIHHRFDPEIATPWVDGMDLRAVEQQWLNENFRRPGCVNLVCTSDGGGVSWSDEPHRKHAQTLRDNPELVGKLRATLDQIRPLANAARWTPEAKQMLRDMNKSRAGIPQDPEHVAKRAEANRGRRNTPETIARMSESARARCISHPTFHGSKTKALISSQQRGRVWVHNETINRRVWPHEAQELLSQGWQPNRLPNRT